MQTSSNPEIFSMMNTNAPYKSYKKTILGQVAVTMIDPFSANHDRVVVIMKGDPKKNEPGSIVDVWSEMEDAFIRRANPKHFETGVLVAYKRPEVPTERSVNEITDEEIESILKKPYYALQNYLNKITSVAPAFRFLQMAEEMEKSEKILNFIRGRISELQSLETQGKA